MTTYHVAAWNRQGAYLPAFQCHSRRACERWLDGWNDPENIALYVVDITAMADKRVGCKPFGPRRIQWNIRAREVSHASPLSASSS